MESNLAMADRKITFEELSKEELVKKCKSFITIIQKAKQSKSILLAEIEQLRGKAEFPQLSGEAESVEVLTRQKEDFLSTIDDLKKKNESLVTNLQQYKEEKKRLEMELNSMDNENIAFKRQISRLSEDNDQLINHLESLEKQIEELNKIGLQQQKELLQLEEQNNMSDCNIQQGKIKELEKMLSISLDELKNVRSEKFHHDEKSKDSISEICITNEKLKEKLKFYHSKIVKLAMNVNKLKEEKSLVLDDFKLYTEQVNNWKDKLNKASEKLLNFVKKIEHENDDLKKSNQHFKDLNIKFMEQLEAHKTDDEKSKDLEEIDKLKRNNHTLTLELTEVKNQNAMEINELQIKNDELKKSIEIFSQQQNQLEKLSQVNQNLHFEIEKLTLEKNEYIASEELKKEYEDKIKQFRFENAASLEEITKINEEKVSLNEKIDQLSETIRTTEGIYENEKISIRKELEECVIEKNKLTADYEETLFSLKDEIKLTEETCLELEQKLKFYEKKEQENNMVDVNIQTETDMVQLEELDNLVILLKGDNSQLLVEMKELNQELKQRGETISELEAHIEELQSKIMNYESQAEENVDKVTENQNIIKELERQIESLKLSYKNNNDEDEIIKLKSEINELKEKLNANAENCSVTDFDIMSTSTLSRAEELGRLKDLEESWEEKYSKLKNLAIKLKAKLKEQSIHFNQEKNEKAELEENFSKISENLKELQTQHGNLSEEYELMKRKCMECAKIMEINDENLNCREQEISKLKNEIEEYIKNKRNTESWKKQIALKVQALRKELEEKESIKKEYEIKLSKLEADLEAKEEALKLEIDNHRLTRNSLLHSTNENKKNTVLNLEMQDYEKSVKELSQKLEKKSDQITKLKGQIESQKGTINALREQSNILEEKNRAHERDLETAVSETTVYKKKTMELENVLQMKKEEISALDQQLELSRSRNEEISTELSRNVAEDQRIINQLREEKEHIYLQNLNFQQTNRELQQNITLKESELLKISDEYENYKIRAQSVLRQNQSRDIGLEEKLNGNVSSLKMQVESLKTEIDELRNTTSNLQKDNETLVMDKNTITIKNEELNNELTDLKSQHNQLWTKYNIAVEEHNETVRSLKIHAETLSQCYRQQLSDQEVRHNREIVELQSKIEKPPIPAEITLPISPTMAREEGEGSESIESLNNLPVSLERLLSDGDDKKVHILMKQISDQESKLTHLTELLADTEQDLAKHVQMNKVLKEEIRRQQRAVEREKHAENLEYLKNIVFKFITLNSGDERSRLVPVLNTILKLSPEEFEKLNLVAKGDPGIKAWSSYLNMWSSPNKP